MELLELICNCEEEIQLAKESYLTGNKNKACNELGEMSCFIQDNLTLSEATAKALEQPEKATASTEEIDNTPKRKTPEQPATDATKETTEQSTPAALALDGPKKVIVNKSLADCVEDAPAPRKETANQDK